MRNHKYIYIIIAALLVLLISIIAIISSFRQPTNNQPTPTATPSGSQTPTITSILVPTTTIPSDAPTQPVLFLGITIDYRPAMNIYIVFYQGPQDEAETAFNLYKQQAGLSDVNVEYRSLDEAPLPPRAFPQ